MGAWRKKVFRKKRSHEIANYMLYTLKCQIKTPSDIISILGWGIVAYPVIQAIGRPEFEDGLRTGVLLEDC